MGYQVVEKPQVIVIKDMPMLEVYRGQIFDVQTIINLKGPNVIDQDLMEFGIIYGGREVIFSSKCVKLIYSQV